MNDTHPDPYAVLGVAPTATAQQISRAYRRLLRRHHPDTRSGEAVLADATSGPGSLADLLTAYAVLRDPVTRAEHDRSRLTPPGRLPDPLSARPGPCLGRDGSRAEDRARSARRRPIRPSGSASASRWRRGRRSEWARSCGAPPLARPSSSPGHPLLACDRIQPCGWLFPPRPADR